MKRVVSLLAILLATAATALADDVPPPPNAHLLYEAAYKGDFDTVKNLLADDPTLARQRFERDVTPLHAAALSDDARIVDLLIEDGAAVDATGGNLHLTPLYIAVSRGCARAARSLLDHGANPNVTAISADDGSLADVTPLHQAALLGRADLSNLLLVHGAKLDAKTNRDETAYDYAVRRGGNMATQVLSAYRRLGAKARPIGTLIAAIESGDSAGVAKALSADRKLATVKLDDGVTPLHLAAGIGNETACVLLLQRGADPNAVEISTGFTPSGRALNAAHLELSETLRARERPPTPPKP